MSKSSTELASVGAPMEGDGRRRAPRLRTSPPATREDLTAREREVLTSLAEGLSTEAIAESLEISRVTVRNHVQRILQKLGAHTRVEALATAYRLGLLAPPGRPARFPGFAADEDLSLT